MVMERYNFRVIGPNIDESVERLSENNDKALDFALSLAASYPLNTRISVYHVTNVDGVKYKQYIGTAEHVVRRTF